MHNYILWAWFIYGALLIFNIVANRFNHDFASDYNGEKQRLEKEWKSFFENKGKALLKKTFMIWIAVVAFLYTPLYILLQ